MAYEHCNITGHFSSYPVKAGMTRTDEIFREFIQRFWKYSETITVESGVSSSMKGERLGLIVADSVLLCAAVTLVGLAWGKRAQQKRKELK